MRILASQTSELPSPQRAVAIVIGILVVVVGAGIAWWLWRRRMRELHPTVAAFYRDEHRRSTRASLERITVAVLLTLGAVTTLFWSVI